MKNLEALRAADLRRLAREAEKLAYECVNNGPKMTDHWPSCAIGESLRRADIHAGGDIEATWARGDQAEALEAWFSGTALGWSAGGVLTTATRMRALGEERTAVVFPLLAFADALRAAARSASRRNK